MVRPHISRPVTPELLESFAKRLPLIRRGDDDCWPYSTSAEWYKAYGRVSRQVDGVFMQALAHRVSATYFLGRQLGGDEVVMHACDYKPCVNPAHLEIGTASKNEADAYARGQRRRKTHCKRGHRFTLGSYRLYRNQGGGMSRHCIACGAQRVAASRQR